MKTFSLFIGKVLAVLSILLISCQDNTNSVTPCSGEAGNESGVLWASGQTANEIVNGVNLVLSYDAASSSFVGTLKNLNTTVAPQVRVEVHVFDANNNSTEFGPTTPADMAPGESRSVTLPITQGLSFVQYNMHPEVGSGAGEGSGGGEGNEGSGGAGEGNEGSGGGETGNESGVLWAIDQTADETVNGVNLILDYDAATSSFVGMLENINTTVAPGVRVEVHIFDANNNSTEFGPTTPADMAPREVRTVTLPITPGSTFVQYNMHPEVGSSTTNSPCGGEGGGEGGSENGGG